MDINNAIEYWKKSAEEDEKTARILLSSGQYAHCLFFCHIMLEKLLKGFIVKRALEEPPLIHNLVRLAEVSGLPLSQEQVNNLAEINTFNIRTRYDDYKFDFYKKATKDYTDKYFTISNEMYVWLKEQL